jgi:hypothetical protein
VWQQDLPQQGRGGKIALVHFIAHAERLGHYDPEINTAKTLQHRMQGRGDRFLQPAQALQHTGIVGPKAQDFAESFIKCAIGVVPVLTVCYDQERHTGGDDACHWPYSAQAMAGL